MKKRISLCAVAVVLFLLLPTSCGKRTYTVTYEWGYDGRSETETVEKGALLSPEEPFRAGYDFDGWYVVQQVETEAEKYPESDETFGDDDSFEDDDFFEDEAETEPEPVLWDLAVDTVQSDLVLRAKWKPKADTIYLDANGADCEVETTQFYYGEPVAFPEVERDGYYLEGWYIIGLCYRSGDVWWGNPSFGAEIRFKARWTTFPPGMTVTFGTYEQDNDLENGKEPIEWIVLDYRDGQYLLFARYILEGKKIHDEYGAGARAWQTCSLRTWLNTDFYTTAFTEEERSHIVLTRLEDTATQDYVFLLSYEEIEEYTFGADYTHGRSTAYAKANGLEVNNGEESHPEFSWWWVRTPRNVADAYDYHARTGSTGNGSVYGVRPVIWVDEDAIG